jgi:hypothetical protein
MKMKDNNDTPPVFKSWFRLYSLVLINLIVLIVLFYWFTKAFE